MTDNKIYCVSIAPNEDAVSEHAWLGAISSYPGFRNQSGHRSNDGGGLKSDFFPTGNSK